MAYIDYTYYTETFGGQEIPASDFPRLANTVTDIIDSICDVKPEGAMLTNEKFLRANGYGVEFLYQQGGLEAIFGRSDASQSGGSESLGNYSVSEGGSGNKTGVAMWRGIPVSSMLIELLEQLGLLHRWLYAYRYREIISGNA